MKTIILQWVMTVLLLCGASFGAQAFTGMIYQPLLRDMKIPTTFWPKTFSELRQQGFDTLVIQWTRHGDIFSSGIEQQWLKDRLKDAVNADLNLVIGLYADPDSFSSLDASSELLEPYFLVNNEKNMTLAKSWLKTLPVERIVGWYLPMEIDDRRWRARDDEKVLSTQLRREVNALRSLSNKPVYLSAFFKGHSEPSEFKELLTLVRQSTGLGLWVQDGRGTKALLPSETDLYLKTLAPCADTPVAGLVYEIFHQVGPDSNFKAEPLTPPTLAKALQQRAPCGGDSVFFELRYLFHFPD